MAEVADLLLHSTEEANLDAESHLPETLDPAPFSSSAAVPPSVPPPSRWIPSDPEDLIHFEHDSVLGSEYPDTHLSLALDFLDQCPPPAQDRFDLFPEYPNFRVFEMADETAPCLELELGSGSGVENQEDAGGGDHGVVSDWGAEEFFLGRRSSVSESIEFSRARPVDGDGLRIVGFESDSDSDEQIVAIGADLESPGALDRSTDDAGLPLCWDCLRIEDDRRDPNEEFEWEEVDVRLEEREVLSMMVIADEEGPNALREFGHGDVEHEEEDVTRNTEWEVLVAVNNLGRNPMDPEDTESYFVDDHEGYVYTSEYEILVGQFADHDSSLKGGPPAAKLVVENLPTVVLAKGDIADNNIICAVCKDEIFTNETVKRLPCSHHYHEECILPWLGIRNTCPLCRFELLTDDPEYERWKARRAGSRVSEEESRVRYGFEILPEA